MLITKRTIPLSIATESMRLASLKVRGEQRKNEESSVIFDDSDMALTVTGLVHEMRFTYARRIIHRDLKPPNSPFEIPKSHCPSRTRTPQGVTAQCAAPEVRAEGN
jgi:serine/threonine protein kinase